MMSGGELIDLARLEAYPAPFSLVFYVVGGAFWLAGDIFRAQPIARTNRRFLLLGITVGFWVLFGYLSNVVRDEALSLLLKRLNFAAVAGFLLAALLFAESVGKQLHRWMVWVATCIAGVLALISTFTPFIIQSISLQVWGVDAVAGVGMPMFYCIALICAFVVLWLLVEGYQKHPREVKKQRIILFLGILAFTVANIVFNIIIPSTTGSSQLTIFGDLSAICILLSAAYVSIRTDVFTVRIASTKILAAVLVLYAVEKSFRSFLDGHPVEALVSLVFLGPIGFLVQHGIQKEISLRTRNEKLSQDLSARNTSLMAISDARKELLLYASHQIRSPLASMRDYIDLLRDQAQEGSPYEKERAIGRLAELNRSLLRLTSSLFAISEVGLGQMALQRTRVEIRPFLEDCLREIQDAAGQKGLRLELEDQIEERSEMWVDEVQLKQAIVNILDNAVRYTKTGTITLRACRALLLLTLEVEDTGVGIEPSSLASLFETKKRGRNASALNKEGMGVGLYLAKRIIDLHGGTIRAETRLVQGTRVIIQLPQQSSGDSVRLLK